MADTANSRIVIKTAGIYRVTAQVRFSVGSASGLRAIQINRNGVGFASQVINATTGNSHSLNASAPVIRLAVGDALQIQASQTGTSAITLATDLGGTYLSAEWIGI
jgi:hypothetical protein